MIFNLLNLNHVLLKRFLVVILLLLCTSVERAGAQMVDAPYITWEDFVQSYLEPYQAENDSETDEDVDLKERLEALAQHPMQINLLGRDDLLQLPFITGEQADSLLSYRAKKHGFVSLGELQLIRGFDYYTRVYLSLFVRCEVPFPLTEEQQQHWKEVDKLTKKLFTGNHVIDSRLDWPLYQREGYAPKETPTTTNWYAGNSLHHVVRYCYHYKQEVLYGLTLEKDAGEPVCKQGFYPYDYWSGYVLLRLKDKPWSMVVGDYNVYGGRGLLLGKPQFGGKSQQMLTLKRLQTQFKAHTSADEGRYFRGMAAAYQAKAWRVVAYLSYRKLDGRFDNQSRDTVRMILTSGLHRTLSEIAARHTLACLTAGASVDYAAQRWGLSANTIVTHYGSVVSPQERVYNQYYFRGQTAVGSSLSYYVLLGRLSAAGEWAVDGKGHLAVENSLNYRVSQRLSLNAQQRHFSYRFVSLNGKAMQQGSRVANEQGLMLGARYLPLQRMELMGYVDMFRFPKPTFNAYFDNTTGFEAALQAQYSFNNRLKLQFRYQAKQKQYNYTYKKERLLERRMTQKLRAAAVWTLSHFDCNVQADVVNAYRQSGKSAWGAMLSTRVGWKPSTSFQLKAFTSLFATDDYDSRVYAYEPQLLHAMSFSSFFNQGWRGVLLANWQCMKSLTLSLRYGALKYFNRSTQSSGTETIHSSWKNDLSLQFILKL